MGLERGGRLVSVHAVLMQVHDYAVLTGRQAAQAGKDSG